MNIVVYSKQGCPFCSLLKMELNKRGHIYTEFDLTDDSIRKTFYEKTGTSTVPQVFLTEEEPSMSNPSGNRLGGYSEVSKDWKALDFGT